MDGGDAFLRVPELVDCHVQHHQHLQHPPASTQSGKGTIMTIIGWIDIEEHLDVRHCKLVIIETMCRSLSLSVPFDKKRHPLLQIHINKFLINTMCLRLLSALPEESNAWIVHRHHLGRLVGHYAC